MIRVGFHGAAGTVTGSKYLLTINDRRYLIDCGMFQGRKELRQRNWVAPPFDATAIDAVLLTHAHIDHVGYLPRLVRMGYTGKIYASAPTCDLTAVSLLDCAHIQEEDADYRNRKHLTHHKVALPLFNTDDSEAAIKMLAPT
ncbi:MAG: MBL fold metallo-hydrolase, partial [Candidatus Zixiibacteriota bacterium]